MKFSSQFVSIYTSMIHRTSKVILLNSSVKPQFFVDERQIISPSIFERVRNSFSRLMKFIVDDANRQPNVKGLECFRASNIVSICSGIFGDPDTHTISTKCLDGKTVWMTGAHVPFFILMSGLIVSSAARPFAELPSSEWVLSFARILCVQNGSKTHSAPGY